MFAGTLTLRTIRKEASNAYTFVFEKPHAAWLAGQHFMFLKPHFPFDLRGVSRVFTISSSPQEDEFTFTTRCFGEKSSSFKKSLLRMKPGVRLWAFGPSPLYDRFRALEVGRHYVFLAGGLGITPVRATLKYHAQLSNRLTAALLYANRDQNFVFKRDLDGFQAEIKGLSVAYVTSPEHIDATLVASAARAYTTPRFLVSGSRRFVGAMAGMLKSELGIRDKDIVADLFRPIPLSGGGL